MNTCTRCGAPMNPEHLHCVRCGQPRASSPGTAPSTPGQSPAPATNPWTPAGPSAPQGGFQPPTGTGYPQAAQAQPFTAPAMTPPPEPELKLAHGEVIKRVFEIGGKTRGLGWLTGQLTVTDSRIVYKARAKHKLGESRHSSEMQVKDAAGVFFTTRRGFTALSLLTIVVGALVAWLLVPMVLGLLLAALALGGNYRLYELMEPLTLLVRLITIVAVVVVSYVRWKSTEVLFVVLGRDVGATPIGFFGQFGRQQPGSMAMLVAVFGSPLLRLMRWLGIMDAEDAGDEASPEYVQAMYDEFGALILDLQNRGVLGDD